MAKPIENIRIVDRSNFIVFIDCDKDVMSISIVVLGIVKLQIFYTLTMLYNSKTLRLRRKSTFVRLSNKRMKIAILGYGKMGKVIEKIALKRGHSILLKVNRENLDFDLKLLKNCDVAIEFSSPES